MQNDDPKPFDYGVLYLMLPSQLFVNSGHSSQPHGRNLIFDNKMGDKIYGM